MKMKYSKKLRTQTKIRGQRVTLLNIFSTLTAFAEHILHIQC